MNKFERRFLCSVLFLFVTVGITSAASAKPQPNRPNILFCIADDASFPHMGAYGCSWVKTPGFDRVAREGLLFTNAYTPNAKCAPSRACILTGRNSWQLKEAGNHMAFFPPEFKTYVEALADSGYAIGKTAKGWAPGVAVDAAGKRRNLAGPAFNQVRAKPPANGISPIDYAANFEQFLKASPQGKPWCFWYGGLEPHRRYEYGSGVKKAGKKITDIDRVPAYWPDNEVIRNDMLDYAFEIEHFDQHLVRMLNFLEQRNELENTIIVVTADNGMPFPRVKGQEYERSNHLPLAVMWKQGIKKANRVIDDYVSFIDFAPTFVEAAGMKWEETGMQPATGRSLTDIFHSAKSGIVNPQRDHVLIGKERHDIGRPSDQGYPIRGIVKGGMLYLKNDEPGRWPAGNPETGYLNCDGTPTKTAILQFRRVGKQEHFWAGAFGKRKAEELYSIQDDPECMKNLAALPEFQAIKNSLKQQMHAELTAQKDPRVLGNGAVFESYQYSDARTRNFYQRYMQGEKIRAGWVSESDFESGPLD
ncbi:MAG: sulfatase [Planctomycetes bacterium]|nr:sulfatase [Planctomycetota bacterium]